MARVFGFDLGRFRRLGRENRRDESDDDEQRHRQVTERPGRAAFEPEASFKSCDDVERAGPEIADESQHGRQERDGRDHGDEHRGRRPHRDPLDKLETHEK